MTRKKQHAYVLKAVSVTSIVRPTLWKCAEDAVRSSDCHWVTFVSGPLSTSAASLHDCESADVDPRKTDSRPCTIVEGEFTSTRLAASPSSSLKSLSDS